LWLVIIIIIIIIIIDKFIERHRPIDGYRGLIIRLYDLSGPRVTKSANKIRA